MKLKCKICGEILSDGKGLQLNKKRFICGNCKDEIVNIVIAINERYVLTSIANEHKEKETK